MVYFNCILDIFLFDDFFESELDCFPLLSFLSVLIILLNLLQAYGLKLFLYDLVSDLSFMLLFWQIDDGDVGDSRLELLLFKLYF